MTPGGQTRRLAWPLAAPWLLWGLCATAWALLAAGASGALPSALCLSPAAALDARLQATLSAAGGLRFAGAAAASWLLMVCAMTPPTLAAPLGHTVARSYPWRAAPAALEFVAGYLAVWALIGACAWAGVIALSGLGVDVKRTGAALALGLAAAWQLTPWKARAVSACRARATLRATGPGADLDCVVFGLRHGARCALSCWAVMLAVLMTMPGFVLMAAVTALVIAERSSKPVPAALTAVGLALFAVWTAAVPI